MTPTPPDDDDPARGHRPGRSGALRRAAPAGEIVPTRPRPEPDDELDEGPSQADLERFSGVTRACPSCRREVYDDADVCYHCGEAMNAPRQRRVPVWAIIAAAMALIGLLLLTLRP
ncbi:MAG: hypothetical protein C0513_06805 [Isosphaera sp.]|nr:hypothetical protein [Isosphaera sp.]